MKKIKFEVIKNEKFDGKEITIEPIKETCKKKTSKWLKLLTGALVGFANGFWGGGGGMICVPILSQAIKLPEKKAHATTLLIMLPLSIASLIVYYVKGNLPLEEAWQIGIGFVIGGIIGAILLKLISNVWLGIVFSVVIIAGGIKMLI